MPLLQLEWQRVDFKRNEIILRAEDTKTAKPRRVPMNEAARVVLLRRAGIRAEICPDTPWVFFHARRVRNKEIGDRIGDIKRSIKSAAKRVGLEGVTFHTLRHTCASWLGQEGIGSLTIRDILGHTSIRTTDRSSFPRSAVTSGRCGPSVNQSLTIYLSFYFSPTVGTGETGSMANESRRNTRIKWWARLGLNQ